jgi:hypothetical protein
MQKVLFTLLFLLFAPSAFAGAVSCLHSISPDHTIHFPDGPNWNARGVMIAGKNCVKCKEDNPKVNRKLTKCMMKRLEEGNKIKDWYEANVKDSIIKNLSYTNFGLPTPSADQLEKDAKALYKACPILKWGKMKKMKGIDFEKFNGAVNKCAASHLCDSKATAQEKAYCKHRLRNDLFPELGVPAYALFQTKLADEAVQGITEVDFVDDNEDEIKVKAPKRKKKAPYKSEPGKAKGISRSDFLRKSNQGQSTMGQLEEAEKDALKRQMGCPDNAELSMGPGSQYCVRWRKDGVPDQVVTLMDDMKGIVNKLMYKDLTAFAVKQVWQSYSLTLLMDPDVANLQCSEGKDKALDKVKGLMGYDAYMESLTNPREGVQKIQQCFSKQGLGLGTRVDDLAQTAYNRACGEDTVRKGARCEGQSDDKGYSKKKQIEHFKRRVEDLHLLKKRMSELKKGKFKVQGKEVKCGSVSGVLGGQQFGDNCGEFFKWMDKCSPKFHISHGCRPPDILSEEQRVAYKLYKNLQETRNYILSKNPELAAPVKTLDENDQAVTKEAWETFDPKKKISKRMYEKKFDHALEQSRKKKLDLILNQACDDPSDFAKKLLTSNPKLINDYIKQSSSPDIGMLLCVGMSEAQADERSDKKWKMAAMTLTMALSAAAAIPSGGTSLALGLTVAAGAGAAGMTLHDIKQAYDRAAFETGMHHGCIGDYNKARQAQQALEDAMIRAAIDMGLSVTMFAGMSAVKKIAELKRMGKIAKGIEGVDPQWLSQANKAGRHLKKFKKQNQKLIAGEYGLDDLPGLMKRGKLTKKGRKTADAIAEMEAMGIPRSTINQSLRSCVR